MAVEAGVAGITLVDYDEHGFELQGDGDSLRMLAEALATADAIQIRSDTGSAWLQVLRSGNFLRLRHDGVEVTLAGQQQRLDDLAATTRWVAAGPVAPLPVQFHAHVEWFEGHLWLDPDSEHVVISLRA